MNWLDFLLGFTTGGFITSMGALWLWDISDPGR